MVRAVHAQGCNASLQHTNSDTYVQYRSCALYSVGLGTLSLGSQPSLDMLAHGLEMASVSKGPGLLTF